ncbi:hypothetical protein OPQ81_005019 [Rhizoctonia solani]|nr:hypothetical protein OPQ81_005019 [Rhizoctonia solani]
MKFNFTISISLRRLCLNATPLRWLGYFCKDAGVDFSCLQARNRAPDSSFTLIFLRCNKVSELCCYWETESSFHNLVYPVKLGKCGTAKAPTHGVHRDLSYEKT